MIWFPGGNDSTWMMFYSKVIFFSLNMHCRFLCTDSFFFTTVIHHLDEVYGVSGAFFFFLLLHETLVKHWEPALWNQYCDDNFNLNRMPHHWHCTYIRSQQLQASDIFRTSKYIHQRGDTLINYCWRGRCVFDIHAGGCSFTPGYTSLL